MGDAAMKSMVILLESSAALLPPSQRDCFVRMIPEIETTDRRQIILFRSMPRILAKIASWQAMA